LGRGFDVLPAHPVTTFGGQAHVSFQDGEGQGAELVALWCQFDIMALEPVLHDVLDMPQVATGQGFLAHGLALFQLGTVALEQFPGKVAIQAHGVYPHRGRCVL
jgi:hypothetical protein